MDVFEVRRYSSRAGRPHPMDGYLGRMEISDFGPFGGWLRNAELVGVGKSTAFGFGRLEIVVEPMSH